MMNEAMRNNLKEMLEKEIVRAVEVELKLKATVTFIMDDSIGGPAERLLVRIDDLNVAPGFKFNEIVKQAERDGFEEVTNNVVNETLKALRVMPSEEECIRHMTKEYMLDNVFFCLISKENNEHLLPQLVNRDFLDLSIVYRVNICIDENGTKNYLIKDRHAQMVGVTEQELWEHAMVNTPRLFPLKMQKMYDALAEMAVDDESLAEYLMPARDAEDVVPLTLVTNECKIFGAATILCDGVLEVIGQNLQKDFVMIPSSIHEWLIHPVDNKMTVAELNSMVHDVNTYQVPWEEVLSDHVYLYCRETKKIIIPDEEALRLAV